MAMVSDFTFFNRRDFFYCGFLSVLEGVFASLPYFLTFFILKGVVNININWSNVIGVFAAIVVVIGMRVFIAKKNMVATTDLSYAGCANLRIKIAEYLFCVPMGFFYQYDAASIVKIINKDVAFVETIFSQFFSQFVVSITMIAILIVGFSIVDWRLALVLIIALPFSFLIQGLLKGGANKLSSKLLDSMAVTQRELMDWVFGIREIRVSGVEHAHLKRLEPKIRTMQKLALKHECRVGIVPLLFMAIPEIGFSCFLALSVYLYYSGSVSLVIIAIFLIVSVRVYLSIGQLAITIAESRFMSQSVNKINAVFSSKTQHFGKESKSVEKSLTVNNLFFSYAENQENNNQFQLKNIDFSSFTGNLTAIVGGSGSGKTTLLHLLARYWMPCKGNISIDDTPINNYSDRGFYSQVALVSQDIHLFDDTIMNNFLLVNPRLTAQDIYKVCRQTQCHEFIRRLPDGYNTYVGEAGKLFSGGELQRIALAQALLVDAKILLFDEITSALDVKNEHHMVNLLEKLKKDKIIIMITHRESLMASSDQVVMLKQGDQCLKGRHDDLLISNREYRQLWNYK